MWRRTLRAVAVTLPFLCLALAAYVVAARFTLWELPGWPVLLIVVPWAAFVWVWSRVQRVTTSEAARYLDRSLDLDERVSTCVELINATKLVRGSGAASSMRHALFTDAAEALDERLPSLPSGFRLKWSRAGIISTTLALLVLVGSLTFPTGLELIRGERGAVTKAVQEQLTQVRALRSEIEANEQISAALKASILQELADLEARLQGSGLDQASGIATLADAEERLRSLLQTPSSDFDGLVAAARLVWNAAVQNSRIEPWEPIASTDLGRAAEASLFMGSTIAQYDANAELRVSISLERAAEQSSGRDAELSRLLSEASDAVRTRDDAPARKALAGASQKFAEADKLREDSVALENVLSRLNKGREQIAQAGRPQTKKQQVGFRRRTPSNEAGGQTPTTGTDDTGAQTSTGQTGGNGGGISATSGMGPLVGKNSVAAPNTSQGGASGGTSAQTGGQAGSNTPGGSNVGGGKSGQEGSQPGGGNQQTSGGGAAGGAAGSTDDQGTLSGSISGPVGGGGGAISRVENPSGQGNSTEGTSDSSSGSDSGSNGSGNEEVYVPASEPGAESGGGTTQAENGTSDPTGDDPRTEGVAGTLGEGASSGQQLSSGQGTGETVRVRTPYKEVIAEYARQASEAIERAYVPPDAKAYVKDYFSQLGK